MYIFRKDLLLVEEEKICDMAELREFIFELDLLHIPRIGDSPVISISTVAQHLAKEFPTLYFQFTMQQLSRYNSTVETVSYSFSDIISYEGEFLLCNSLNTVHVYINKLLLHIRTGNDLIYKDEPKYNYEAYLALKLVKEGKFFKFKELTEAYVPKEVFKQKLVGQ